MAPVSLSEPNTSVHSSKGRSGVTRVGPRSYRWLLQLQKRLVGLKLLIIDELGFVPLSKTGERRHTRGGGNPSCGSQGPDSHGSSNINAHRGSGRSGRWAAPHLRGGGGGPEPRVYRAQRQHR